MLVVIAEILDTNPRKKSDELLYMAKKYGGQSVSESGNSIKWDAGIPSHAKDSIRRWFVLWGLAGFEQSAVICFSSRMSRAFGRCYIKQRRIRIAARLKKNATVNSGRGPLP